MEYNNKFIELMKAGAPEIVVDGDDLSKIAILVKHGDSGEVVKMRHGGEWLYSFMSEDEIFKRVMGMTKEQYALRQEYLEDTKRREKNRFILAYVGRWKDEFKRHYEPKDFQEVDAIITKQLNQDTNEQTLALYLSLAKVFYILRGTQEKPMYEVAELYYSIDSNAEKRLNDPAIYFLLKANKGEFYTHLIYGDIAETTGETEPAKIEKKLAQKYKEIEEKLKTTSVQPEKH